MDNYLWETCRLISKIIVTTIVIPIPIPKTAVTVAPIIPFHPLKIPQMQNAPADMKNNPKINGIRSTKIRFIARI